MRDYAIVIVMIGPEYVEMSFFFRAVEVGFKNIGFSFFTKKLLKTSKVRILGFKGFFSLIV